MFLFDYTLSGCQVSAVQHLQRAGLGDAFPDLRPQRQHRGRRHAQLVDPDGQEGLQQTQVRPQLSADTDPDPRRVCRVRCNLEGAEDRRVVGVKELAQVVGLPVSGQGVLGQVVGPH